MSLDSENSVSSMVATETAGMGRSYRNKLRRPTASAGHRVLRSLTAWHYTLSEIGTRSYDTFS